MTNIVPFTQPEYAYEGTVIKLTKEDYDRWKKRYRAIPDFDAALGKLDDYYSSLDDCGNWFIRCSAALDKEHQKAFRMREERNLDRQRERRGLNTAPGGVPESWVRLGPQEWDAYCDWAGVPWYKTSSNCALPPDEFERWKNR